MLSKNILLTGRDTPAPETIPLRAGPLHMLFDQGDLRAIRLGDREILRRVYVAIRDRNWGTIAARLSNMRLIKEENAFTIEYDVENRRDEIAFAWHGVLRGTADGKVTFSMDGAARSTFMRNRIGFCVLFPAGIAGQQVTIEHVDGTREDTIFPEDISADQPVQPFAEIRAMTLPLGQAGEALIRFQGDVFEMEDQRLWTDASYKVFCTPLSLPHPVEIRAGTRVVQSIELTLQKFAVPDFQAIPIASPGTQPAELSMPPDDAWKPMPLLGVCAASHGGVLEVGEIERLKALHLHHLRVDLPLADHSYPQRLKRAAGEAAALGIGLEVALQITADGAEDELRQLRGHLDVLNLPVSGWLVYPAREINAGGSPTELVLRAARRYLADYRLGTPFAAGTNTDYIFLKRTPPPVEFMDQVCITLNPQVHAFDDRSLVETLEAQPTVVKSAKRLAEGLPVVVSPITLKPRFNAYATGPDPQIPPGSLPSQVDPRQLSLFGAGWTLGSLRAMVLGGAVSVTCYETTGWRGVMEQESASRLPQAFPSLAGAVFPLYHVLADCGDFAGGQAAPLCSSDSMRVSGLALQKDRQMCILFANHTAETQTMVVAGLEGALQFRILDEKNAVQSMQSPEDYRQHFETAHSLPEFSLPPYALLRIDALPSS